MAEHGGRLLCTAGRCADDRGPASKHRRYPGAYSYDPHPPLPHHVERMPYMQCVTQSAVSRAHKVPHLRREAQDLGPPVVGLVAQLSRHDAVDACAQHLALGVEQHARVVVEAGVSLTLTAATLRLLPPISRSHGRLRSPFTPRYSPNHSPVKPRHLLLRAHDDCPAHVALAHFLQCGGAGRELRHWTGLVHDADNLVTWDQREFKLSERE